MSAAEPPRRRTLYGRRHGPKLRPNDRERLSRLLPELALALPVEDGKLRIDALLAPGTDSLWLEIGFGGGEHLFENATAHPGVTHLGVEPYLNGVASLLRRVDGAGLRNVRVLVDDARLLLAALEDGALARIAVLFPDPWPKARHHKRRIVNDETAAAFARLLRPGGELRVATDHAGYATWMLQALATEPRLLWSATCASDWRERPADWPSTRYEMKALAAGSKPVFLRYIRAAGNSRPPGACKTSATSPLSNNV